MGYGINNKTQRNRSTGEQSVSYLSVPAPQQVWQKVQVNSVLPSRACTSTGVTESTGEQRLTFPCLHLDRCDRKYRWTVSYLPVPAPRQVWQKVQVNSLTFPCLHLDRCDRKYRWTVSYLPVPAPRQVWQKVQVNGVLPSRACTSTGVPSEGLVVKKVPTFFPFTMLMMAFSSQPLQITTDTPFFSAHVAAFTCHTNHLAYNLSPPSIHHLSTLSMLSAISSMSCKVNCYRKKKKKKNIKGMNFCETGNHNVNMVCIWKSFHRCSHTCTHTLTLTVFESIVIGVHTHAHTHTHSQILNPLWLVFTHMPTHTHTHSFWINCEKTKNNTKTTKTLN